MADKENVQRQKTSHYYDRRDNRRQAVDSWTWLEKLAWPVGQFVIGTLYGVIGDEVEITFRSTRSSDE